MIFFQKYMEEENIKEVKVQRRVIRDSSNPLELSRDEFRQNFRVSKEIFVMIMEAVNLEEGVRETATPAILQLAVTLHFLANGGYQINLGSNKLLGMAQTTVSKFVRNSLKKMEEKLCPLWIKLDRHNFEACRRYFYDNFKIPGVVGCIDGTHIKILKPKKDEHVFFNRKGYHILNVMVICDHNNYIMAVDSSNGGASHDSSVYKNSKEHEHLKQRYCDGYTNIRLLGDSGYSLQPWLLTPYRDPADMSREMHFNGIHAKARSVVERTIGILKGRWRCLSNERQLRFSPQFVATVVNVSVALHNICIKQGTPPQSLIVDEVATRDINTRMFTNSHIQRSAESLRDSIRDSIN